MIMCGVMKRSATVIIATIAFLDSVAALTSAACSVDSSGCGRTVNIFVLPVDFVIDVSDPIDPGTLDASDFTVNGTPASTFVLSNGNTTITFHFDSCPAGQGVNTLH